MGPAWPRRADAHAGPRATGDLLHRLEQESKDGRSWTEKLYMMKPERVTYLDGSRVEDNEVGLARINP